MRIRVLLLWLLLAALGAGAGAGVAVLAEPGTSTARGLDAPSAAALPGWQEPLPPPIADIDYPTLAPVTTFDRLRIGGGVAQTWRIVRPRGWTSYCYVREAEVPTPDDELRSCTEVRFRPPGEPITGGYSLRVKVIADHIAPVTEADRKLTDLLASPDLSGVEVVDRVDAEPTGVREAVRRGTLLVTLRTGENRLRHNYFQWFAAPGSSSATLEMSVAGRLEDAPALLGLFDAFAARVTAVD
ncbi:hypothetical protein [Nocardioides sp. R-C-SC26]|uniref:hypothetical protein n=1 Tax=Nocardioides sp. R-C-SC26 TaxID=2870414 RepID=UPI001E4A8B82|nr:hypothetical protein [Nocardioides sp. R-C-SC26]